MGFLDRLRAVAGALFPDDRAARPARLPEALAGEDAWGLDQLIGRDGVNRLAGALDGHFRDAKAGYDREMDRRRDEARERENDGRQGQHEPGSALWASVEDVILVLGGPRTGKSAWLGGAIIDAPGGCVVTSTRADLYTTTHQLRARLGRVDVYNPDGVGSLPSSVAFDPLAGCETPATAAARAEDMIRPASNGGGGDRDYWDGQARRVLGALMHAAALADLTMHDVLAWVADPDRHAPTIERTLRSSPAPAIASDVAQFLGTNDKTRTSITASIMPALQWLSSPSAVESTRITGDRPALQPVRLPGQPYAPR